MINIVWVLYKVVLFDKYCKSVYILWIHFWNIRPYPETSVVMEGQSWFTNFISMVKNENCFITFFFWRGGGEHTHTLWLYLYWYTIAILEYRMSETLGYIYAKLLLAPLLLLSTYKKAHKKEKSSQDFKNLKNTM